MRTQALLSAPLVSAAILATASPFSIVLAQSPPAAGEDAGLQEVVVTAQKREQNAQDIGLSLTSFSGDELRDLNITSPEELSRQTPGLHFNLNANDDVSMTFSLRGVGLDDFSAFNEAPVAVYFDDVYQATLAGNNGQLFDVERVEVLKGPQGTLYGKNTTGGIVHFISRRPTDQFESYFDASVGEYALRRFEGAISGPLAPWLKARLSAVTNDNDGYSKARFPGVSDAGTGGEYGVRLQLQAEPSSATNLLLSGYYADVDILPTPYEHGSVTFAPDGVTDVFLPANEPNPLCPGAPGADCLGYQDRDGDPYAQDNNIAKRTVLHKFGTTLTFGWQLNEQLAFTSITAYQTLGKMYREDADAGPVDGIRVADPVDSRQFTQELRLAGGGGPFRWTGGFYYFDRDVRSGPTVDLTGVGFISGQALAHDNDKSSALFGQVEYDFASRWTGIAGLRYTKDKREFELQANDLSGLAVLFGFPPNPIIDFRRATVGDLALHDDDSVSAHAEIDWRPIEHWLAYGSISRGIKGAGFNQDPGLNGPRDPATIPVAEEVLTAYEVGFKSTLLDQRARLNAAVFYYDYNDFQAFTFEDLLNKLSNQDASIKGFEAEFQARPWQGWDLRLGLELLDTNVEGLTRQSRFTQETVALGDREMAMAPDAQLNGSVRYEWPMWSGHMALQGDFVYLGKQFLKVDNNPTSVEDAYTVGNGRLVYETDRYSLALWVKNIAGTEYRTFNGPITSNGYTLQQFGRPRWFGASFRVSF